MSRGNELLTVDDKKLDLIKRMFLSTADNNYILARSAASEFPFLISFSNSTQVTKITLSQLK